MKTSYRRHDWFDEKNKRVLYGIQAKAVGYEVRWLHCAEDDKPLLFENPADRDAKLKELRKQKV